jgi:hypothetical protein
MLFLKSYIFKQITVIFFSFLVIVFLFSIKVGRKELLNQNEILNSAYRYLRIFWKKAVLLIVIIAITFPIVLYFSPKKVSNIRIKLLSRADFNLNAFVYLLYELNKLQKNWYFEVDFDPFDEKILSSKERELCAGGTKNLCYAETISDGQLFIGITSNGLGRDFFWQNRNKVSVISTFGWKNFSPPSVYEYLIYSIITQSILIHLNTHCEGLPVNAFKQSRVAYGDLFQFLPRRNAIRANILAAHLNYYAEELLLNCFGAEYMSICSQLLTMEWLHSERILNNLKNVYKVEP